MKKALLIASLFVAAHAASAQSSFQASLTPEIAIVPRGENVRGLALNIWGENEVNGASFGIVNGLAGQSSGFSWSLVGTYAEDFRGVIWGGIVAYSTGEVRGWQSGLVNISSGSVTGLQSGFVNLGTNVRGVQLGFVNYTEDLYGVQIGLANIVRSNPWFTEFPEKLATGFPIVNWSF